MGEAREPRSFVIHTLDPIPNGFGLGYGFVLSLWPFAESAIRVDMYFLKKLLGLLVKPVTLKPVLSERPN